VANHAVGAFLRWRILAEADKRYLGPKLRDLYPMGAMNLDQLSAFAIAEDHERQERAWSEVPPFNRLQFAISRHRWGSPKGLRINARDRAAIKGSPSSRSRQIEDSELVMVDVP
jgi:hypothetical protein